MALEKEAWCEQRVDETSALDLTSSHCSGQCPLPEEMKIKEDMEPGDRNTTEHSIALHQARSLPYIDSFIILPKWALTPLT